MWLKYQTLGWHGASYARLPVRIRIGVMWTATDSFVSIAEMLTFALFSTPQNDMDFYERNGKALLPIRWMAPEVGYQLILYYCTIGTSHLIPSVVTLFVTMTVPAIRGL